MPAGVHATDFGSAARVYWTLKVAGHEAVSILDGGFAAWTAQGYPVETGVNPPSPKIFTVTLNERLLAVDGEVEAVSRSGQGATLLDAGPAGFFAGKVKAPAAKAYGHIPGALNLDSATFYDSATNRLRPKAELAAIAQRAAGRPGAELLQYRSLGVDQLVRAVRAARPQRRSALRRLDGRMDRGRTPARVVGAHALGRSEEGVWAGLVTRDTPAPSVP